MPMSRPSVDVHAPDESTGPVRGVALYLHGGKAQGTMPPSDMALSLIRMRHFESFARDTLLTRGAASWLLRYRVSGWNDAQADTVQDARWALAEVRRQYGSDIPVALVGHSMGGRAVLRVGGDPLVRSICALAPWIPPGEPSSQLQSAPLVVIAHGRADRWTSPAASRAYAEALKRRNPNVARFELGGGHSMIRSAWTWHRLALAVTLTGLGLEPLRPDIANAVQETVPAGLRVAL